jgi:hypothetical protein
MHVGDHLFLFPLARVPEERIPGPALLPDLPERHGLADFDRHIRQLADLDARARALEEFDARLQRLTQWDARVRALASPHFPFAYERNL